MKRILKIERIMAGCMMIISCAGIIAYCLMGRLIECMMSVLMLTVSAIIYKEEDE